VRVGYMEGITVRIGSWRLRYTYRFYVFLTLVKELRLAYELKKLCLLIFIIVFQKWEVKLVLSKNVQITRHSGACGSGSSALLFYGVPLTSTGEEGRILLNFKSTKFTSLCFESPNSICKQAFASRLAECLFL